MSNLAIFKDSSAVATTRRPISDMTKSAVTAINVRRIQTNTNGTFKRIVGGEQIGKAIRGEFNAIIVAMLPKVSRTYYKGKYDPNAKPTLPDCWSNLGDRPEQSVKNPASSNCASCPMNIEGSGENGKGKACRFQRRVALLLEGDDSGDVYQFNIPAKSLFGKGNGNTHPFESYVKYLVANEHSLDYVVTNIAYDLDAETMQLQFTPVRPITDDEYELVVAAQGEPDTQRLVQLTVAEADGAAPSKPEPQAKKAAEPKPAPKWSDDDDDDGEDNEQETPAAKKPDPEVSAPAEPTKRASKKEEAPKAKADLTATLNAWLEDDEEEA